MAEDTHWNLTIVAVVALVSVVGLVALVMNGGGSKAPSYAVAPTIAAGEEGNAVGQAGSGSGDWDCGTLEYIVQHGGTKSRNWAADMQLENGCNT